MTSSLDNVAKSFFLYEKSVLCESDSLRGRSKEVCTDLTTIDKVKEEYVGLCIVRLDNFVPIM